MFKLKREISFCYGHRLINYPGKCRNLHGHNGRAIVSLESEELDDLGMVADFSDIKKIAGKYIDEHLDHRMLLHKDDPVLPHLKNLGEPVTILDENPTAENIAKMIFRELILRGLPVTEVELWETDTCVASFSEVSTVPQNSETKKSHSFVK
jgi:6-pyruvoyltetrahydropterin/6-carboxytetrahydropterin synthase